MLIYSPQSGLQYLHLFFPKRFLFIGSAFFQMVEEVLRILNAEVNYTIVNMPSRIKMIVDSPPKMDKKLLDRLPEAGHRL